MRSFFDKFLTTKENFNMNIRNLGVISMALLCTFSLFAAGNNGQNGAKSHYQKIAAAPNYTVTGDYAYAGQQTNANPLFIAVAPIPNVNVVGQDALNYIYNTFDFDQRLKWATNIDDCGLIQDTIDALVKNNLLTNKKGNALKCSYTIAAGGFEGISDPTYVFAITDSSITSSDINILSNALGYVLNQGGVNYFDLDHSHNFDALIPYVQIKFTKKLSGDDALEFFECVGTIDNNLFEGAYAGYTQTDLKTLFFLQPDTSTNEFTTGMKQAAQSCPVNGKYGTYVPVRGNYLTSSVGFPGNDWAAYPDGSQYLDQIPPSKNIIRDLQNLNATDREYINSLLNGKTRVNCNKTSSKNE
jgi:hypothetical protein